MTMRSKRWICAALCALLATAGCDDLLTESPKSFLTPDNFYRTTADAEAALVAVYDPLKSPSAFRANLWLTLDGGSDESIANPVVPNALVQALGSLDYSPTQERITTSWRAFYQVITRANLLIERMPQIEASEERKAALVAEARFLRAFAYFHLVRLYGDVPLVTTEAEALAIEVPRTPVDEVYGLILEDARAAVSGLPTERSAGDKGRATRGAALAVLTDVHLTRREWQEAADVSRQLLELGIYNLQPDYLRAFLPAFEGGVEDVFSIQFIDTPGIEGSTYVYYYYPREVGSGRGGGWAWLIPNPTHTASYPIGDYRREVNYSDTFLSVQTGKLVTVDRLHTRKFRPSQVISTGSGDVNVPVYRYAGVLLMHAEALNELGRSTEAVSYLNRIRQRARNADGEPRLEPADYAGDLSASAVREAIFQERKWELAHEGKRWFDLVRRGEEYWASQLRANDPQAVVSPHKMLLPIPQEDINQNRALVQNPGY